MICLCDSSMDWTDWTDGYVKKMVAIHWFHGRPRTKKRCLLAVWWMFMCFTVTFQRTSSYPLVFKHSSGKSYHGYVTLPEGISPYSSTQPSIYPHDTHNISIISPLISHFRWLPSCKRLHNMWSLPTICRSFSEREQVFHNVWYVHPRP
jgi:hypothetical protein